MSAKSDLVAEWLKKAENDFIAAEACEEKDLIDIACFHCQQAIEKAIKAYLVFRDSSFDKIHDIAKLIEQAAVFNSDWLKYRDAGRRLTPYAVLSRYPEAEDEPNKTDLAVFKGTVREILKFSKNSISAS